jgi:hypothetical protein
MLAGDTKTCAVIVSQLPQASYFVHRMGHLVASRCVLNLRFPCYPLSALEKPLLFFTRKVSRTT